MSTLRANENQGFSPDIAATLLIHGERFKVGSLGPNEIMLQDARRTAPGRGVVRLLVDKRLTIYRVELIEGIDPSRPVQPLVILPAGEEAVA
jgi:hypothetical protein